MRGLRLRVGWVEIADFDSLLIKFKMIYHYALLVLWLSFVHNFLTRSEEKEAVGIKGLSFDYDSQLFALFISIIISRLEVSFPRIFVPEGEIIINIYV